MKVEVFVTLRTGLNDAQGDVVGKALHSLGYDEVQQVRIGKYIELEIAGDDVEAVRQRARAMAEQLLSNPIIEDFAVNVASSNPHGLVREAQATYQVKARVEDWRGFHMSVEEYMKLDWDARSELHWEFQQLHGDWIAEQKQSRNAEWLLVTEGRVDASGPNWRECPDGLEVGKMCLRDQKLYWTFSRDPVIEEISWAALGSGDAFPTVELTLSMPDGTGQLDTVADFDSGSNATLVGVDDLKAAGLNPEPVASLIQGVHLGARYSYTWARLRLTLTDDGEHRSSSVALCAIVHDWKSSPYTKVNPSRRALAGRDLLMVVPAAIELDGATRTTRVTRVGPP